MQFLTAIIKIIPKPVHQIVNLKTKNAMSRQPVKKINFPGPKPAFHFLQEGDFLRSDSLRNL